MPDARTAPDARIAYVNGEFRPIESATVSILDRGFLFGDGIYEVWGVLDGRPIDEDAHAARLERSLREIGMAMPMGRDELRRLVREMIARNRLEEGLVYLEVTRGAADRDFAFPKDATPTVVLFTQAKAILASKAADTGVAVITVPDQRWARRDIKSVSLLAQVLAKQAAAAAGAGEAWMVAPDGTVTEGGSSTAFIVLPASQPQGPARLVTRPLSQDILPGCTRKAVLALCAGEDVVLEERPFTVEEARDAQEAFYTSASGLVMPVVRIDDSPVADGRPGDFSRRMRALYVEAARAEARASEAAGAAAA